MCGQRNRKSGTGHRKLLPRPSVLAHTEPRSRYRPRPRNQVYEHPHPACMCCPLRPPAAAAGRARRRQGNHFTTTR